MKIFKIVTSIISVLLLAKITQDVCKIACLKEVEFEEGF